MADILRVNNLVKSYGTFALNHVDLTVPQGCVTGFIGSNGAGKSTTIRSILGMTIPDSGTIELFGRPTTNYAPSPQDKERIGVVFDTCPFPGDCHVKDVGSIGKAAFQQWNKKYFDQLLAHFGISEQKQIKDLSRGMSMKLQLAFALSHEPELLILDEATAGLDPLARDEVLDMLQDFMQDEAHGILLSSHITTDLEKIADHIACIDNGEIVFNRTIDSICDETGIAHCTSKDAEALLKSALFDPREIRIMRNSYSTDVLVPDRILLRENFPHIACDRASLDEYMRFILKGETR